jgi:hypothetical protein
LKIENEKLRVESEKLKVENVILSEARLGEA